MKTSQTYRPPGKSQNLAPTKDTGPGIKAATALPESRPTSKLGLPAGKPADKPA